MNPSDPPPLNFSKTQRIVLLIDLHPLLTLPNPSPYLSSVSAAARRLLLFPPLSSSLFSFNLFFSSLSSLRSSSLLPLPYSLSSFNLPPQTLASLSQILNSLSTLNNSINPPSGPPQGLHSLSKIQNSVYALRNSVDPPPRPRASHVAGSLMRLIHDYAWETGIEGSSSGKEEVIDGEFVEIPSNLVVLFSPISDMIDCSVDDVFASVRDAFVSRGIHVSWIDVKGNGCENEGFEWRKCGDGNKCVVVEEGIRRLGWGFCSSDLVVLGSGLLPFGLIYPTIGARFEIKELDNVSERKCDVSKGKCDGQLVLEILDVKGMQLECKFCELELVELKSSAIVRSHDLESRNSQREERRGDEVLGHLGSGSLKLNVKAVYRCGRIENIRGLLGCFLVSERFQESSKNKKNSGGDGFFADSVLEMVHGETAGVAHKSQIPTWQILLSFLYMKGYCALVYIANSKGDTLIGCLKPLTAHFAVLSVWDTGFDTVNDKSGSKLHKEEDRVIDTHNEDMNSANRCLGCQTDSSTSANGILDGDVKKKKSRRDHHHEMTWSSFCKAAFEGSDFDLFEVYMARPNEKSNKKLKFLKCWMKQIGSVDPYIFTMVPGSKSKDELPALEQNLSEPCQMEEGVMPDSHSETSETFFNNLSNRIQQGLESEMDLQSLAERIVKSSIHWLRHKFETEIDCEGQHPTAKSDNSFDNAVGRQLMELLLRAPKDMKKIYHDNAPSQEADDPSSSSENIVREYELQILLRMEILQSDDVAPMMEESRKQKLVKHICSLLEIIQFLLPGGLHGHISLYDYFERTIRARYSDVLEDVVKRICTKLELLPLGDEDEAPSHLFNSEDSNQSWRDRHERYEKAETSGLNKSVSTEGDSSQPFANASDSLQEIGEDNHVHILNEARERRERNRRFVSFTSWVPDLQRVWAPKQRKVTKCEFEPVRKKSRKKDGKKPSYSVVCETPMTGNIRACARENNVGDEQQNDLGNQGSRSVSKALFQE